MWPFWRSCGVENVMKKVEKVNSIKVNLKLFFKFKLTNGRWLSDKQIGNELAGAALQWNGVCFMLTCPHLCICNTAVYLTHEAQIYARRSLQVSLIYVPNAITVWYCENSACTIDKLRAHMSLWLILISALLPSDQALNQRAHIESGDRAKIISLSKQTCVQHIPIRTPG